MDRREALKKMAVGGATIVGASTIMSQVAFANPGSSDCSANTGSPTVTFSKLDSGSNLTATITYGGVNTFACRAAPCGGTAIVLGTPSWNFGGTTATANSVTRQVGNSSTTSYTVTFRVKCLDRNGQSVCAVYTGTGSVVIVANNIGPGTTQPSGSLAYDSNSCP